MPQLGQTTAFADWILDATRNVKPLSFGITAAGLYDGPPGAAGSTNVFAGAARAAVIFNAASGGAMSLNTANTFAITAATDTDKPVAYICLWNGLTGDSAAICWATGYIEVPQILAQGDTVNLASATVRYPDLAA
jgi:hypothetical protein